MNIENFDFITKQISPFNVECSLINKESKNKYSIVIQSNGIPPNDWIFSRFLEDKNMQHFFIDIESEIIYDKEIIKEEIAVISEELKKVEKSEKNSLQNETISVI